MRITNIKQIDEFLAAADKCVGGVKLKSPYGDVYNLKSKMSQYVAIAELLSDHGDELELFCEEGIDEQNFFKFFHNNPEVI